MLRLRACNRNNDQYASNDGRIVLKYSPFLLCVETARIAVYKEMDCRLAERTGG